MLVLLPAKDYEDGQTVTKRTGTKEYTLTRTFILYGPKQGEKSSLFAQSGTVFLINKDGNGGSTIPDTTLLLADLEDDQIRELLDNK